jgi:hypothetical protein
MILRRRIPSSFLAPVLEQEIVTADLSIIEKVPWVMKWTTNNKEFDYLEIDKGRRQQDYLIYVAKDGHRTVIGFIINK